MASQYEINRDEIIRKIGIQKDIYKFRNFLYSINRDIRQIYFNIAREFLENEYNTNISITMTERDRLERLIVHWQWNDFVNNSTNWWYNLSLNHSTSLRLKELIGLWIDDIQVINYDTPDNATDGIR